MMMKLQLVCAIFILLCTSTRKLSAFGVQVRIIGYEQLGVYIESVSASHLLCACMNMKAVCGKLRLIIDCRTILLFWHIINPNSKVFLGF